ncbi:hypothetical protein HMI55_002118, partial [Coelomomyces lativittatus]
PFSGVENLKVKRFKISSDSYLKVSPSYFLIHQNEKMKRECSDLENTQIKKQKRNEGTTWVPSPRKPKYSNQRLRERCEKNRATNRATVSLENWKLMRRAYEIKFLNPPIITEHCYKDFIKRKLEISAAAGIINEVQHELYFNKLKKYHHIQEAVELATAKHQQKSTRTVFLIQHTYQESWELKKFIFKKLMELIVLLFIIFVFFKFFLQIMEERLYDF